MPSNYELMQKQMEQKFTEYDQEELIHRFNLEANPNYISFLFMGSDCRIDRNIGAVECLDPHTGSYYAGDYNEAMTIYDLLCYSAMGASPSGEYVSMNSLSSIQSAGSGGVEFFKKDADLYDRHLSELKTALSAYTKNFLDSGDLCAEIEVFDNLRVQFRFWQSDEDFAPDIQFLWDKNVLQYMHYETVWFANHAIIDRINRGFL